MDVSLLRFTQQHVHAALGYPLGRSGVCGDVGIVVGNCGLANAIGGLDGAIGLFEQGVVTDEMLFAIVDLTDRGCAVADAIAGLCFALIRISVEWLE